MNKKDKTVISMSTVASLLLTSSLSAMSVKAASVDVPQNPRLWGQDRYETAEKVSQEGWTSSDYAVIASGEGYADALCATPLAGAKNAPMLLTEKNTLNQNTINELKRLNVKHVYIIGGEGVVNFNVEAQIKQIVPDTQRLGGQDRFETSTKVAKALGSDKDKVVLASGEGYADALSAAPVASIEGIPILLTEDKKLSQPTADYIKSNPNITTTYVIGGYASVSDAAMNSAPGAERFGGADRYATNQSVIKGFSSIFDLKNAYVALGDGPKGDEFADALTGSVLAAKNKAPLIITSANKLNSSTEELVKSLLGEKTTITILGGTANVSDSLVSDIDNTCGSTGKGPDSTVTPGGGSGGGGGTSISRTDITKDVLDVYNENIRPKHPKIEEKYASVDPTKYNPIEVQLKKDSLNSLKNAFDAAQKKNYNMNDTEINSYLDDAKQKLELYSSKTDIKIGNETIASYLGKMKLPCIKNITNENGEIVGLTLDTDTIKQKMEKDKENYDYNVFVESINEKITHYVTENTDVAGDKPKLSINYGGLTEDIQSITKDGKTVYSNSDNVDANVKCIRDLGLTGVTAGDYEIDCVNPNHSNEVGYIRITVLSAPDLAPANPTK